MGPREFHDIVAQTITDPPTSMLHCRKKAVRVVNCSWKKKTRSREYHFFLLVCDQLLWSLHHFNIFRMLIVESRGFPMAALSWYPILLSSRRTVLVVNGIFRCWFHSAATLVKVVWCFLPTMRFYARRSMSVSLEVWQELFRLPVSFYVHIEFCSGPWYGSSRKTKQLSCFGDWGSCHTSFNNLPFFKLR